MPRAQARVMCCSIRKPPSWRQVETSGRVRGDGMRVTLHWHCGRNKDSHGNSKASSQCVRTSAAAGSQWWAAAARQARSGLSIAKLLAGVALRVGRRVVAGQGVVRVRAGDERDGIGGAVVCPTDGQRGSGSQLGRSGRGIPLRPWAASCEGLVVPFQFRMHHENGAWSGCGMWQVWRRAARPSS